MVGGSPSGDHRRGGGRGSRHNALRLTSSARSSALVCAAFVLLASAFPTGETQASFAAATQTGPNSVANIEVGAPALNAGVSASAGQVQVSWSASSTAASQPSLRYRVLRRPTGVGSNGSLDLYGAVLGTGASGVWSTGDWSTFTIGIGYAPWADNSYQGCASSVALVWQAER